MPHLAAIERRHVSQFFQYAVTGGISFAIDFGLLYLLTDVLHVHYLQSATLSYLAGFFWCFEANRLWTFGGNNKRTQSLKRFTLIAGMNYGLTLFLLYLFVNSLHWHYLVAKIFIVALATFWTFFLYRWYVYSVQYSAKT